MSAAEIWHGLGGWRWVAFVLAVAIVTNALGRWLFPGQTFSITMLGLIAGFGCGAAWGRYRSRLYKERA